MDVGARSAKEASPQQSPSPQSSVAAPALIPTRLPSDVEDPSPEDLIPADARLLTTQRVAMSGGKEPEIVVTWERTLGRNRFGSRVKDNAIAIWHRYRKRWKLAFQIHETPLEQSVVGECHKVGCYRSMDGERQYTLTFVIIVSRAGPLSESDTERPIVPAPDGQFIKARPVRIMGDDRPELFITQDSTGSAGVSIYRALTWDKRGVFQPFTKIHGDGCIVPADGHLLLRGSVFRHGDAHCCPSFLRYSQLTYNPKKFRFARVRTEKVPLSENVNPPPPEWASSLKSC